jgi:carbon monoxide dehydrogenase subunit G
VHVKISGTYFLPVPQERAYQLLQDPETLARALPGCEGLEKIAENEYRMKMKILLASLAGNFDSKVKIAEQAPPSSFRLLVEGSGRPGFVRGDGLLRLSREGTGTAVSYEGDVQVGGTIAAVGQRLLDGTAKMLIKKFFETLSESNAATA